MAVRRSAATSRRRTETPPARPAKKAVPAPTRAKKQDVSEYAEKPATPYQRAFATWIVKEIGFDPESATSKKAAFLRGVAIAVAARPAFNASDFIEEWRERTGETKRGPKPVEEKEAPARRRKAAPEPVVEDDDFEEDDEIESDDDDDFEDDDSEEFDEDDESDDEEDDFEEEEEPAPAPKRPVARKAAPASKAAERSGTARKPAPARAQKATPAKTAPRGRKPAPKSDDDDFIF